MRIFEFNAELWLPRSPEEIFPFFADAYNLEKITPGWLRFEVLTPRPVTMRPGALIDYRIRLRGLPMSWRTEICVWEPPFRFVDQQLRGPYRQWIHEHRFESSGGGTLCRDHVRYAVLGGALVNKLFVRRDVERIFAHRQKTLLQLFGPVSSSKPIAAPPIRSAKPDLFSR
ncbi:MAG: SRPBCC family protein [Opitutaceae bacterium]|nr:SRPBCC family protein [Verrucomicrobiales bacterium]